MTLYLRSRGVPAALGTIVLGTVGVWALDSADLRLLLLVIGLGVAVAADGLGGFDVDLDRAAAIPWPPRRFSHLLSIVVVVAGLVAVIDRWPFGIVVRDSAGLAGLAALGAAVLGRQLAWMPPVTWVAVTLVAQVDNDVLMWLILGPANITAIGTAVVLGLGGGLTYCFTGSRS